MFLFNDLEYASFSFFSINKSFFNNLEYASFLVSLLVLLMGLKRISSIAAAKAAGASNTELNSNTTTLMIQ